MTPTTDVASLIPEEFRSPNLGDERRAKRLARVAAALARTPSESIPKSVGSAAEQEAAYRLLGNEAINHAGILSGHVEETAKRARAWVGEVLVLHDTTEFQFSGRRLGLAPLRGPKSAYGFFTHASLCVGVADTLRDPLGVLGWRPWVRTTQVKKMREARGENEKTRWWFSVRDVAQTLGDDVSAIHVMDRESDMIWLVDKLNVEGERFIIREFRNRKLPNGPRMREEVLTMPVIARRQAQLGARKASPYPTYSKLYPARNARSAEVEIRAGRLAIPKGPSRKAGVTEVNVVHVREQDCPPGEAPVEWFLLTSEPIDSAEAVLAIVDWYRTRWVIEEYFKALKTGCQVQKLQMQTYETLLNAIAIYVPIAWLLLRLRDMAREHAPEAPATAVLNTTQVQILKVIAEQPLPDQPTVLDALMTIARRGGHNKNNGPPGWLVLARGMRDLMAMEQGFLIARMLDKCDQS